MTIHDDLYTLTQEDAHKLAMYGDPDAAAANGAAPDDDTFTLHPQTARALCDEPDTGTDQLLGPLVLAGGRTIIVGDTGEGKTSLAFQLIRTILTGTTFLDWQGAGDGRALIIDLEQGRKSVKRGLRDSGLADRDDVDLVLVPDGLSLDRDPHHLAELERVIHAGGYTIVDLDPYYKAHRADEPNSERPIVDLMRTLDALRTRHGFALLLPAHPRKEQVGAPTVRKLTIHDIAGSGAVTRGAELVIGIERVSHGLARLRFLKDREGDLPIGEAWNLTYTQDTGFKRDPKDQAPERNYRVEILDLPHGHEWRTIRDYMETMKAGEKALKPHLADLVEEGILEYAEGPEGRQRNAKCWRQTAASANQMQLNAADAPPHFEHGKLSAASGVSPLRGTPVDAEAAPPAASTCSESEVDLVFLDTLDHQEDE